MSLQNQSMQTVYNICLCFNLCSQWCHPSCGQ